MAYYWTPTTRDLKAGFTLHREALGGDLAQAIDRAEQLNRHLDDWRDGRDTIRSLDVGPAAGSLDWLVESYYRTRAFTIKVSERVKPDYRRELRLVCDVMLSDGRRAGQIPVAQMSHRFADKLYQRLLEGPRGRRVTQANNCLNRIKNAWSRVQPYHPKIVPKENPFTNVVRETQYTAKKACTREQAIALADAIAAQGQPYLALAPLICFEWHYRPENVIAGCLTWADWRPVDRRDQVQVFHRKTGERIWLPLEDHEGPFFSELEARMRALKKVSDQVVVTLNNNGLPTPLTLRYVRRVMQRAREAASLPAYVTLDACRHGGITELGDAGLTEQGVMALSGHKTAEAARLYDKRTLVKRLDGLRSRRRFVNAGGTDGVRESKPA